MENLGKVAILGSGNIGFSLAEGLVKSKKLGYEDIILTNKVYRILESQQKKGFNAIESNIEAVKEADILILAVEPQHIDKVFNEIKDYLDTNKHIIVSLAAGVTFKKLEALAGSDHHIVRAMPNTAMSIRMSMTTITMKNKNREVLEKVKAIFNTVGETIIIEEDNIPGATALASCGIAFFFRAIRAAAQGGTEVGFHSKTALKIAAQTAKGAAELILVDNKHPEDEIDRVTTPKGVTISGLNQLEHEGFSSAMIKGITTAEEKFRRLSKE